MILMLPFLALAGILLAAVVGVRGERWPHRFAFTYATLLSASAIALALYVASEDDYRRNGISRWDAYDAHGLTVAAIAVGLAAAIAVVGATSSPTRLAVWFLGSSAAFVLCFVAFLANSLN